MGLMDRDYYRDEPRGTLLGGDRSMVANLIIINVALYIVDALFFNNGDLIRKMALRSSLFERPWDAWQLLTYGFAHDYQNIWHIVFNMLALWFFGRDVEGIYGRRVFLQLYLTLIILSGLCWLATSFREPANLVGASGAVFGIMLLFVLHFPTRTILLFGVVPMRAWFFMAAYLFYEFYTLERSQGDYVAHAAHLGGALFGFVYYKTGWTLFSLLPGKLLKRGIGRRPKLKLHAPEQDDEMLSQRVDQILEKISREGEASLTKEERRVLEDASRRYQKRRN
jgi:membrane associated rhomboid family serine protease